jgi:hypothetical protein
MVEYRHEREVSTKAKSSPKRNRVETQGSNKRLKA